MTFGIPGKAKKVLVIGTPSGPHQKLPGSTFPLRVHLFEGKLPRENGIPPGKENGCYSHIR
jgi:hypothetical protein